MMPSEEVPSGSSITSIIEEIDPLKDEQRHMIAELFNDLEVAHDHMARSCNALAALSKSLNAI